MNEPAGQVSSTGLDRASARAISLLLVIGVGLSAALLALGLALLVLTGQTGYHQALNGDLVLAREGAVAFPRTMGGVWQGVMALKPFAVIELGALLLIATPVFRVAASTVLFWLEKDYLYTAVTLAVFVILVVSIFWLG